ncbi:MAG: energy transducer TonB [Acidobacteriia bacterium]|nr:energy transducer TonB [Terriglobia bacterium]
MQSAKKALSNEAFPASTADLRFALEPEPWLRIFTRNIGDLFRKAPPPVWISSAPGKYWPDALVHRPVAWKAARQSFLGHALVIAAIYALNLAWLNQPQVLPQTPPNQTVIHYEVSEYLPPVNTQKAKPEPPRRVRPQKADPEFAPQEIVVTNENHISTRQTIVQPSQLVVKQDTPLPNLIVSTAIPGAPIAMNHPIQVLPVNVPPIGEPAQPVVQSRLRPLLFPPAAQPEVAAPAEAPASHRTMPALPVESAIVVPPSPDVTARKPDALQLPAQAPPQVAAPAPEVTANRGLQSIPLPMSAPQVAPPAPTAASRNLSALGLPAQAATAVPPAPPVANGNAAREKALGQLLVLNAQPVAPSGPLIVPEGNRPGEFAASPAGHSGATARPEIAQHDSSKTGSPSNIYVSAPPTKVASNTVIASASPPAPRPLTPDKSEPSRDSVDTRVFGTRRHYSMRLSMPNLTSSTGSWSIRFAELNATHGGADLSAPEAITKVDPAYPQDLMHDRVEGTVVLYAVIHADGSVGDVKVLEGFDDRLNENARKALEQWRFRPGTKDGMPVDIEAVVRVPFKVPRREF